MSPPPTSTRCPQLSHFCQSQGIVWYIMILNIISLITNELGLVRYLLIVCYDLLIPFILKVLSFSYWFAKVSYTISISVPCWLEALQVFGHLSVNLSLCRTEVLNFDIFFLVGAGWGSYGLGI